MSSDEVIGGKWRVQELLAVGWSDEMAQRFPNAEHVFCRQEMRPKQDAPGFEPFDPPRCMGWHCNRCGAATNSYGHHDCPDRAAPESALSAPVTPQCTGCGDRATPNHECGRERL